MLKYAFLKYETSSVYKTNDLCVDCVAGFKFLLTLNLFIESPRLIILLVNLIFKLTV